MGEKCIYHSHYDHDGQGKKEIALYGFFAV